MVLGVVGGDGAAAMWYRKSTIAFRAFDWVLGFLFIRLYARGGRNCAILLIGTLVSRKPHDSMNFATHSCCIRAKARRSKIRIYECSTDRSGRSIRSRFTLLLAFVWPGERSCRAVCCTTNETATDCALRCGYATRPMLDESSFLLRSLIYFLASVSCFFFALFVCLLQCDSSEEYEETAKENKCREKHKSNSGGRQLSPAV